MRSEQFEKGIMGIAFGILFFFLGTILLATFTRQVLVKRLDIQNAFTSFVFAGDFGMEGDNGREEIRIDWQKRYPYEEMTDAFDKGPSMVPSGLKRYPILIESIKTKISDYCEGHLMRKQNYVELAKAYDKLIGWNLASFSEYNGVVELPDGYLTSYVEKKDGEEKAASLAGLKDYCEARGSEFLYIQAPCKISAYDDEDISGFVDFSNQNADQMIRLSREQGVDVLDLRELIHEEGYQNHDLFYRTDNHWLTTTGLWAAQRTLEYCNEHYGFHADTTLLDVDRFEQVRYPEWFLGSQGKKVTLSQTTPDDFVLLYPKYETLFHYEIPSYGINETGDYSVVYDMANVEPKDYYGKSPYGACNYGDCPLIRIENMISSDDKRILVIHDSFGDCFISCLGLCEKNVDSLDIRHFTGSVRTFIKETQPDLVMVLYNAGYAGGEIEWFGHEDLYDFR